MTLVIVLAVWLTLLSLFTGLCMIARRGDIEQRALVDDAARLGAPADAASPAWREVVRPAAPQTVAAAHRGALHASAAGPGAAPPQRGRVAA